MCHDASNTVQLFRRPYTPQVDSIYLKGGDWHDYTPSTDSIWTWKSICKVKEKLKLGFTDNCWTPHPKGHTISNGYDWLMGPCPRQNWATIAWNEWNVPKHSFITWLIMQEGINTKVKLHAYGFCQDDRCILCESHSETIEHLFNECEFSCKVQKCVEDWIGHPIPTINGLLSANRNNMRWKILAMIITAYRYLIWAQRNRARIELSVMRPEKIAAGLTTMIQTQIRSKCVIRKDMTELEIRSRLGFF
ncbi:uncharacterized protein LOC141594820 [Silene latifolia]|uniref:uncharacterized protein LOC141594820 n=1 Tax=Silene latifolia TaxID=37657 RepID=UPI003D76F9A6